MSGVLAVLVAAAIGIGVGAVVLFAAAAYAAPRGITSGPLVAATRWLFFVMLLLAVLVIIALVWGGVTRWA